METYLSQLNSKLFSMIKFFATHSFLLFALFIIPICNSAKPTMPGEPLNPQDFQNAGEIVMEPAVEDDMTKNDGTMDDVIESKFSTRIEEEKQIKRWPKAIMPYMLDSSFDEGERAMIARAIQLIQEQTCFRIVSRTNEKDYVLVRRNINSTSCSSSVGMQGGKQRLNLAPRCIERYGSTAHEFMHSMGFYHEQSRENRDRYIRVNQENILEGSEHNFDIRPGFYGNVAGPYDKLSITHYSRTAFSKNGGDTIQPLVDDGGSLGQRKMLTKLDVQKVNEYYNCPEAIPSSSLRPSEEGDTSAKKPCRDYDQSDCKLYAYYGYCEKSSMFMTVSCKKTCNKCSMGCVDMRKDCGDWVKKNYCMKHPDYMSNYCARSCRTC